MQSYMHMRCQARQLDSYSTARHCSTARQLDRTRQSSTELDRARHPGTCSQSRLASTGSTATRQLLDRQGLDSTSTAARRSLDSSTARQPGLKASNQNRHTRRRSRGHAWRSDALSRRLYAWAHPPTTGPGTHCVDNAWYSLG